MAVQERNLRTRRMTYSALLLALAVLMPRVAGLIPEIGKTLNLMHIPVLLCGFLCGWPWGLAVGASAPLLSSLINGMPGIFPDAAVMAFELAAYGAVSGLMYSLLSRVRSPGRIYAALLTAMIAGRVVYGLVYLFLTGVGLVKLNEALTAFVWTRAFVKPVLGIVLQVALVPLLVMALERAGLVLNRSGVKRKEGEAS